MDIDFQKVVLPGLLRSHMDAADVIALCEKFVRDKVKDFEKLRLKPTLAQGMAILVATAAPSATVEERDAIVIAVMRKLWPNMLDPEVANIQEQLRFIHDNGLAAIVKPSTWKRVKRFFCRKRKAKK